MTIISKEKKEMSKKKKVLTNIVVCLVVAMVGYHMYCHYMVGRFFDYLDKKDTAGALQHIEKMPDVNMRDSCLLVYRIKDILTQGAVCKGYPLDWAVYRDADISIFEALLKKGADPNKEDYGCSSAFQAAQRYISKDLDKKMILMAEYGGDLSSFTLRIPAFYRLDSDKYREMYFNYIEYFWENGVSDRYDVGTKYEWTLLHDAVESLDIGYLKRLYNNEKRSMAYLLNEQSAKGETPIFYAVRRNSCEICEFLIKEGADLSIRNNEGKTAYDVAVELGYQECMEVLGQTNKTYIKMVIRVDGWDMEYTISDRKLTVKDFENIEIGSSLAEIESRLGEPDGWVGGGILLPVYVLEDNSAVELVFKNDVTNEELETIYLYRGQEELILEKK